MCKLRKENIRDVHVGKPSRSSQKVDAYLPVSCMTVYSLNNTGLFVAHVAVTQIKDILILKRSWLGTDAGNLVIC